MKKLITIILSLIMAFSLFACDNGDEGTEMTYKGNFFDGEMTLKVNGDSVTATATSSFTEDNVDISMTLSLVGGKATVSGDTVSADFSDNVTYELSFSFKGEGAEEYASETKEFMLSEVTSEQDKKLISDLFDGKTVKFDKNSALSAIAEGFAFVSADVNGKEALYTEVRYFGGDKYIFEYYESGALKKESYYNENGELDYSEEHEDVSPDNNDGNSNNNDGKETSNNTQARPEDSKTEDEKIPVNTDKTGEDEKLPDDDKDYDKDTEVGGDIIIGGKEYPVGTFVGVYEGKDAVLEIDKNGVPVLDLIFVGENGDVKIKQAFVITNGNIISSTDETVIIDFGTENISYTTHMNISGSGAAAYKEENLSSIDKSEMSDYDKQLYRKLIEGEKVTFGKEAYLYNAFKLSTIKFEIDTDAKTFEASDVSVAVSGGNSSSNSNNNFNNNGDNGAQPEVDDSVSDNNGNNNNNNDNSYNDASGDNAMVGKSEDAADDKTEEKK